MAGAALVVEGLFGVLGLIPREHQARVVEVSVTWNYTTWLNTKQEKVKWDRLQAARTLRDGTHIEIAVVRFVARSWKFKMGRRKFTDGCAVRPFC